jgi:hypothetical protein
MLQDYCETGIKLIMMESIMVRPSEINRIIPTGHLASRLRRNFPAATPGY